jgi:hypothetical protein
MSLSFSRVVGILLVIAGMVLLIHPNIPMRSQRSEVQIGSMRTILETRRVVSVPKMASWIVMACGGVLTIWGARRG